MKIVIVCNNSTGLYCFRGLLIETLIGRGNSIVAIVPATEDKHELLSEEKLKKEGCRLIHSSMSRRSINPLKDIKLFFTYIRILRKEHPKLVLTYTIKPNIYGGIACRLLRIAFVANITGLGTAFEENGLVKKIASVLYKIALKTTSVVFFENEENREAFVDLALVDRKRTKVLAGAGVDLEKFTISNYPKDIGETRFLFIGRVMKEKGIDELLNAMKQLRKDEINCTLDIVGWLEEDYADTIKCCEKEGWLRYHGVQSDVRPFIATSHCFVLPSWHEGMANTNLECAASGRPVITSNISGCRESIMDGESGFLCEPQSSEDLYRVMKKFVKLPYTEKIKFGENGRLLMQQTFDKRKVVLETVREIFDGFARTE